MAPSQNTPATDQPAEKKGFSFWPFGKKSFSRENAQTWVMQAPLEPQAMPRTSTYLYSEGFFGIPSIDGEKTVADRMTHALNLMTIARAAYPRQDGHAPVREAARDIALLNQIHQQIQEIGSRIALDPARLQLMEQHLPRFTQLLQTPPDVAKAQEMTRNQSRVKSFIKAMTFGLAFKDAVSPKDAAVAWADVVATQQLYRALDTYRDIAADPSLQKVAIEEVFGSLNPDAQAIKGGHLLSACYTVDRPEHMLPLVRRHADLLAKAGTVGPADMLSQSGLLQDWAGNPLTSEQSAAVVEACMIHKTADRMQLMTQVLPTREVLSSLSPEQVASPQFAEGMELLLLSMAAVTVTTGKGMRLSSDRDSLWSTAEQARGKLAGLIRNFGDSKEVLDPMRRLEMLVEIREAGEALTQHLYEAALINYQTVADRHALPQMAVVAQRETAEAQQLYPNLTLPQDVEHARQSIQQAIHALEQRVSVRKSANGRRAEQVTQAEVPHPATEAPVVPASMPVETPPVQEQGKAAVAAPVTESTGTPVEEAPSQPDSTPSNGTTHPANPRPEEMEVLETAAVQDVQAASANKTVSIP